MSEQQQQTKTAVTTDAVGATIAVGSRVAYPWCDIEGIAELRFGEVLELPEDGDDVLTATPENESEVRGMLDKTICLRTYEAIVVPKA